MIQYVVLPIFALLLTWEYMTSILFQENYFLNRPKWLAFYGFLGSLLFFTTVVLILWKYFLREIRPEEVTRIGNTLSKHIIYISFNLIQYSIYKEFFRVD